MLVYQEFHYVLLLFLYCRLKLVDKRCKIQATKCQGLNSTEHSFKGEKLLSFFVPRARRAQGTMLSCTSVCPWFFSYSFANNPRPLSSNVRLIFVPREDMTYMATFCFKEFDIKSSMKAEGVFREFSCFIGKETEESVNDSSLDRWPWTSVSCLILLLYALFSYQ